MNTEYWQKQEKDNPLFPDIIWSKPESKQGAGKLAIIGGNAHAFGAPGIAYNEALEAGAGVCKVLLPDAIRKTVKHVLPDADYAPSTPSGSFSKKALAEFLETSYWANNVILAGDIGRNSETAVLLEKYTEEYTGPLTITQDVADYFKAYPKLILERDRTMVVVSLAQLQKMFINAPLITPITYGMTNPQLAEALHTLTSKFPLCVVVKHHDTIFVSHSGKVITTENTDMPWRVKIAAIASTYWMHNPSKPLEAAISSIA